MAEWWYSLDLKSIAIGIIILQFVNMVHHWVVIYLKLKIYRITVIYLSTAQVEQIQTISVLGSIKTALEIIKGWAELARIQTSNMKEVAKTAERTVEKNTQHLEEKIQEVPERVVEGMGKLFDSGVAKKADVFKEEKQ